MRIQQQRTKLDCTGQIIFVGIDVGKRAWTVSIWTIAGEHKTFTQQPLVHLLVRYLQTHFPGATYRCAYEAGYSGFWICDELVRLGVDCIVVHPADVPTSDKDRAYKNDPRDSRKIARTLRAGDLVPLYVPSPQALDDRTWVRLRYELVKKQTRCKNQIKSRLAFFGIEIPEEKVHSHWSKAFLVWLENLAGTRFPFLAVMVNELRFLRGQIADITKHIRLMAATERYRQDAGVLVTVSGISTISAMIFLTEIVDIHRFTSRDALASYCGLIPGEHSSGDTEHDTGIARRRNGFLRYILIEAAWVAVRKDPALTQAFALLRKRMRATDAIVRIARKLLSRMSWVLRHHQPYCTGVL